MNTIRTSNPSTTERTPEVMMFLQDARRYEPRTAEEQIELCRKAQAGDEKARAELVHCNLLFIFAVCKKYANGNGTLDLIGAATIGLLKSIPLFDTNLGINFISYAVRGMQDEILQCLNADKPIVNKAENKLSTKVARIRERFYQDAERYPTDGEIIALLQEDGIDANEYQIQGFSYTSFSDVVGDDDATIEECGHIALATASENEGENAFAAADAKSYVKRCLSVLPRDDRKLLKMLYGIGCEECSMEYIASQFGVTTERIRQKKFELLNTIRKKCNKLDIAI